MSEQQSQKRGVRSEAQKTTTARHGYEPIPPANPVSGAFGGKQAERQSDEDLSYTMEEKRIQKNHADAEPNTENLQREEI